MEEENISTIQDILIKENGSMTKKRDLELITLWTGLRAMKVTGLMVSERVLGNLNGRMEIFLMESLIKD